MLSVREQPFKSKCKGRGFCFCHCFVAVGFDKTLSCCNQEHERTLLRQVAWQPSEATVHSPFARCDSNRMSNPAAQCYIDLHSILFGAFLLWELLVLSLSCVPAIKGYADDQHQDNWLALDRSINQAFQYGKLEDRAFKLKILFWALARIASWSEPQAHTVCDYTDIWLVLI